MERVILAFSKEETASKIRKMLDGSMYFVCAVSHSSSELMRAVSQMNAVLIIMSYRLGSAVVDDIFEMLPPNLKLLCIAKGEQVKLIYHEDIFVQPLPVNRQSLISAMDIFLGAVFKRRKHLKNDEEEELIERAKLLLMEKHHMTEAQAHRFIQKRSMDTGAKFIDTVRLILGV